MKNRKTILFDRRTGEVAGVENHANDQGEVIDPMDTPQDWADRIDQDPGRFALIGSDPIMEAQELRDRRKALGVTQEALAGILWKSKSIIEKMESDSPSGVPITGSVAYHIDLVLSQLETPVQVQDRSLAPAGRTPGPAPRSSRPVRETCMSCNGNGCRFCVGKGYYDV